jgi:catechol 2,3-dioxygenase-like lactoylglutathione lyase family enzyme
MDDDYYPMPAFVHLQVADLDRATRYYAAALGFRVVVSMPSPAASPRLVQLRRSRYQDRLLRHTARPRASGAAAGEGVQVYVHVEDERDALAVLVKRVRGVGGVVAEGLIETPWNTREVRVRAGHGGNR